MPPRREDEKMMVAAHRPGVSAGRNSLAAASSPASRPSLFELPKDISFLDIQQPALPASSDGSDNGRCANALVRQRMSASLDRASRRAKEIGKRIEREGATAMKAKSPVVYEACRSALAEEMSRKLDQASLLLEDAKKEEPDVSQLTKIKRLSVALINALQYLDTLESAMAFSSRDRLEGGLLAVLNSMASHCKDDEDYLNALVVDDSLNVCVSSWKAPSLAFDFCVGRPAMLSVPACKQEPSSLPIDLEVRPIIEYTADELIQSAPKLQAQAYSVKVKMCKHELREYGARDGITGEAMVQVLIAPLAEVNNKKKEAVWGVHDDVEKIRVREVRATQQNAYPTKFRINFDLFTSSVYGESGLTLTLKLETCQTMDGKVPKVQIELVVDP